MQAQDAQSFKVGGQESPISTNYKIAGILRRIFYLRQMCYVP